MTRVLLSILAACLAASAQNTTRPGADAPQALFQRGVEAFEKADMKSSAAAFDRLVQIAPSAAPELWQRGITLYYAGRYQDCKAQFELHRTVNPDDVENAAFHYLCVARAESPARARAALLPVGPDPRPVMPEIYRMFKGELSPEQVLSAAQGRVSPTFYANLYVGLFYDANGDTRRANQYMKAAAADQFAPAGGYMHTVAKVHLTLRAR